MSKKGWIPSSHLSAGNCFFLYEACVRLVKPSTEEEEEKASDYALELGFVFNGEEWQTE